MEIVKDNAYKTLTQSVGGTRESNATASLSSEERRVGGHRLISWGLVSYVLLVSQLLRGVPECL